MLTEGNDYTATQVLNNCDLFIGRLLYINTLEFLRTSKKTVEDSLTQDPRPTFEIKGYIQSFGNGLINRVGVVVQDSTAHPSFHNKTVKRAFTVRSSKSNKRSPLGVRMLKTFVKWIGTCSLKPFAEFIRAAKERRNRQFEDDEVQRFRVQTHSLE